MAALHRQAGHLTTPGAPTEGTVISARYAHAMIPMKSNERATVRRRVESLRSAIAAIQTEADEARGDTDVSDPDRWLRRNKRVLARLTALLVR